MKKILYLLIFINFGCSVQRPSYEKKSGIIIENDSFKQLIFIETQENDLNQYISNNLQGKRFLDCIDSLANVFPLIWYDNLSANEFNNKCIKVPNGEAKYLYVNDVVISKDVFKNENNLESYYFSYDSVIYCLNIDKTITLIMRL
ncbi:MAG TPA: hypothetical protein PLJ00_16735 [Chitinophagales bacterium]|nr:hypothetical protein [Chitinophagales bacterium]HRH53574.1 hypothetical protein [Chitinophagales bacterium]